MKQSANTLLLKIVFAAIVILVGFAMLQTVKAGAITGDAAGNIPTNGSPSRPWLVVSRPGSNGMDAPRSTNVILIPSTRTRFTFTIQNACDTSAQDSNPDRNDTVFQFPRNRFAGISVSANSSYETTGTATSGNYNVQCNSGLDTVVTLRFGSNQSITTINGRSYYRVYMTASILGSSTLYYENRFRLSNTEGHGLIFSFAQSTIQPTSSQGYTGISYNAGAANSWGWSTQLSFATPCNSSVLKDRRVFFYDTDHYNGNTFPDIDPQIYWQNNTHPMRYNIERFNRSTGAYIGQLWTTDRTLRGGQNIHDQTQAFDMSPRYKYRITVKNMNYINSLQIALPQLQFYANEPCPPPTCIVDTDAPPATIQAGSAFSTSVAITNPNKWSVSITGRPTYTISAGGVGQSGNATVSGGSIPANTSINRQSRANITIITPGVRTITWSVVTSDGTISCSRSVEATVDPPSCIAATSTFSSGSPDVTVSITVSNSNFVNLRVTNVRFRIVDLSIPYTSVTSAITIDDEESETFTGSVSGNPPAGSYAVDWIINTPFGDCTGSGTLNILDNPYFRTYGNDIIACGVGGDVVGRSFAADGTTATAQGAASQLAIFATGNIAGVVPGSMQSRTALQELAFSNESAFVDLGAGQYGGSFASCAGGMGYETPPSLPPLPNNDLGAGSVSLSQYSAQNDAVLSGTIPNGRKVVVYVDGDVDIAGITYASTSWTSLAQIPSVTIIASGNIYIRSTVSVLDGKYVSTGGNIYTCSGTGEQRELLQNNNGDKTFLATNCRSKLTVNGSLSGNRIHLLRTNGTALSGDTPYEEYDSTNIAEVIRFSPEAYLANGGGLPPLGNSNPSIDSIIARPPSF